MKTVSLGALLLGTLVRAAPLLAQHDHGHPPDSARIIGAADAAMSGAMSPEAKKHMLLSPTRRATTADSSRARGVANDLKVALAKYADTSAAVADGYRMFLPQVKNQRVYHFTNYRRAFMAAFSFDAAKPTSILYTKNADGSFKLVGAMYTAPKRMRAERLDDRIPLSIARWHKHVNWCLPKRGEAARFQETRNGKPVFGPESPIASKSECSAVGGQFHESLFGWMIHANVFEGDDLQTIFGHDH
jgi:hypothetical protein